MLNILVVNGSQRAQCSWWSTVYSVYLSRIANYVGLSSTVLPADGIQDCENALWFFVLFVPRARSRVDYRGIQLIVLRLAWIYQADMLDTVNLVNHSLYILPACRVFQKLGPPYFTELQETWGTCWRFGYPYTFLLCRRLGFPGWGWLRGKRWQDLTYDDQNDDFRKALNASICVRKGFKCVNNSKAGRFKTR